MAEFTDRQGDKWHPEIRFSTLKQIRRAMGVNTLPESDNQTKAQQKVAASLQDDPEKLLGAFYISVKDEADERGLDKKAALKRFDLGPMQPLINSWNDAWEAFLGEDQAETGDDENPTEAGPDAR